MRPVISPRRRVRLLLEQLEDRTAPSAAAISAADPNMLAENAGDGSYSSVSRDGRYIVFVSNAGNVVDGVTDTNDDYDLFLLDRTNPYRTLEVRARAQIMPDADYAFAKKLGAKYGGADLSTNDRPGETRVVVSLQPIKVNTWG